MAIAEQAWRPSDTSARAGGNATRIVSKVRVACGHLWVCRHVLPLMLGSHVDGTRYFGSGFCCRDRCRGRCGFGGRAGSAAVAVAEADADSVAGAGSVAGGVAGAGPVAGAGAGGTFTGQLQQHLWCHGNRDALFPIGVAPIQNVKDYKFATGSVQRESHAPFAKPHSSASSSSVLVGSPARNEAFAAATAARSSSVSGSSEGGAFRSAAITGSSFSARGIPRVCTRTNGLPSRRPNFQSQRAL